MKYKLIFSEPAAQDLDEIGVYLSETLQAREAASHFYEQVTECLERVCTFPMMYELCAQKPIYHKAVIGNYIMLYEYKEDEQTIYVHRFFYGRRDFYKDI